MKSFFGTFLTFFLVLSVNQSFADEKARATHAQNPAIPEGPGRPIEEEKSSEEVITGIVNASRIDAEWIRRFDRLMEDKESGKAISDKDLERIKKRFDRNPEQISRELNDLLKAAKPASDEYYAILAVMTYLGSQNFDDSLRSEVRNILNRFAKKEFERGFFRSDSADKDSAALKLLGKYGSERVANAVGSSIVSRLLLDDSNSDFLMDSLAGMKKRAVPHLFDYLSQETRYDGNWNRYLALANIQGIQSGLNRLDWQDYDRLWQFYQMGDRYRQGKTDEDINKEKKKLLVDTLVKAVTDAPDENRALQGLANSLHTAKGFGNPLSFGSPIAAQAALEHFGEKAIPHLKKAAESSNSDIAEWAFDTIGKIGARRRNWNQLDYLVNQVGKQKSLALRGVYRGLGRYADIYPKTVIPELEKALNRSESGYYDITPALYGLRTPEAIRPAIEMLERKIKPLREKKDRTWSENQTLSSIEDQIRDLNYRLRESR